MSNLIHVPSLCDKRHHHNYSSCAAFSTDCAERRREPSIIAQDCSGPYVLQSEACYEGPNSASGYRCAVFSDGCQPFHNMLYAHGLKIPRMRVFVEHSNRLSASENQCLPDSEAPCPEIGRLDVPSALQGLKMSSCAVTNTLEGNSMVGSCESNQRCLSRHFSSVPAYYPSSGNSPCRDVRDLSSQSASPAFLSSPLSDERPYQRRRLSWPILIPPCSSEGKTKSNASQATMGRRLRSSEKAYSKGIPCAVPLNTSSGFTTFSVHLAHTHPEPAGAAFMSTVNLDDPGQQGFEHGPTDLPPRPYVGGPDACSPWKPQKSLGTVPGSALDYLPVIEDRIARLERAIERYLEYIEERALTNSILPGMDLEINEDADGPSIQTDSACSSL